MPMPLFLLTSCAKENNSTQALSQLLVQGSAHHVSSNQMGKKDKKRKAEKKKEKKEKKKLKHAEEKKKKKDKAKSDAEKEFVVPYQAPEWFKVWAKEAEKSERHRDGIQTKRWKTLHLVLAEMATPPPHLKKLLACLEE